MEERALDRNDVDDVQSDEGCAQAARQREGVGLGHAGMLGGVDADHNAFDHRSGLQRTVPRYHAYTALTRGFLRWASQEAARESLPWSRSWRRRPNVSD